MGHSRGSAVGNILAARLSDMAGPRNDFFYGFATPLVTKSAGNYPNLHSFVFQEDLFPKLPFAEWDFTDYGQIHFITTQSDAQLAAFKKLETGAEGTYLTQSVLSNLCDLLKKFAGNSQISYTQTRPGNQSGTVNPAQLFMYGLAAFLTDDEDFKASGLQLMFEYSVRDTDAAKITAALAENASSLSETHYCSNYLAYMLRM